MLDDDPKPPAAAPAAPATEPSPADDATPTTTAPVSGKPGGSFTQGSIFRHVMVMTTTSTVGIMAIFAVDLLSLFYVARLGETVFTAAVGFASQVLFYPVAVTIGLTIATTALVARALGAGDRGRARQLAASGLVFSGLIGAMVAAGIMLALDPLLGALGATGEAERIARLYLLITLPANVPLALGIVLSGILRATGDARRAMYVTLAGGVVTGIVDPILIFGLHFGVFGAAISTVVSRFVFLGVGAWGVVRVHDLLGRPSVAALRRDARPLGGIAAPAVATNLATPIGNSYALSVISHFGSAAIAATTVTDRLVPVAFSALFALSGAVGPILAQNLGARRFDRVNRTLVVSFAITAGYAGAVWALLWLCTGAILQLFGLSGEAAHYVAFFCTLGVSAWLFIGFLYVANASFNNLGFPWLSMLFNWGRATLGTAPFVTLGAAWGGVPGAQIGMAVGAAIFGTGALVAAFVVVRRLAGPGQAP